MNVLQHIGSTQREVPCRPENRIKRITKLENGGLRVEFHSGVTGEISKDDPQIQAFAVWSVLYEA